MRMTCELPDASTLIDKCFGDAGGSRGMAKSTNFPPENVHTSPDSGATAAVDACNKSDRRFSLVRIK